MRSRRLLCGIRSSLRGYAWRVLCSLWLHHRNISPYCVNTEFRKRATSWKKHKLALQEAVKAIEEMPHSNINFTLDGSLMTLVRCKACSLPLFGKIVDEEAVLTRIVCLLRSRCLQKKPAKQARPSEAKLRSAKKISPAHKQPLSQEAMQAVTSGR